MFYKILVEKPILKAPFTQGLLKRLTTLYGARPLPLIEIEDYRQWWGKAHKPYLQKRDKLNLFIAAKKGAKVKLAPDAYGWGSEPHYYFVQAYNCIYECEYCYLQGYFKSPDLVWFVNHEEIILDMEGVLQAHSQAKVLWFHAGEFSDCGPPAGALWPGRSAASRRLLHWHAPRQR